VSGIGWNSNRFESVILRLNGLANRTLEHVGWPAVPSLQPEHEPHLRSARLAARTAGRWICRKRSRFLHVVVSDFSTAWQRDLQLISVIGVASKFRAYKMLTIG